MSKITINDFVFKKIKIEAKRLKEKHPSLSYSQRLDIASKEIAGRRNYHEVKVHHDQYVSGIKFSYDLLEYECPYCHLSFAPDIEEDRLEHEIHHKEWEKAEFYLRYSPRIRKEREKLKKFGYERISEFGTRYSIDEKIEGAFALMQAYFDASLESAIFGSYWREHPSFEEYISLTEHHKIFPKDVSKYLDDKFGLKIKTTQKYWFPS